MNIPSPAGAGEGILFSVARRPETAAEARGEAPTERSRTIRPLRHDDVARVLTHCARAAEAWANGGPGAPTWRQLRAAHVAATFLLTGMRRRELCHLSCDRAHPAGCEASPGPHLHVLGKGAVWRLVPMVPAARQVLGLWLALKGSVGEPSGAGAPVFRSLSRVPGDAGYLSHETVTVDWHEALRAAGVTRDYHPHTARHTFALYYLRANDDRLEVVASALGHASMETTRSYYFHAATVFSLSAQEARAVLGFTA